MPDERGVCIVVEHKEGEVHDVTKEILSLGRKLAQKIGGPLHALLPGTDVQHFGDKLIPYAPDRILLVDTSLLGGYAARAYAEGLTPVIQQLNPALVLIGATLTGREIAARLAAKLETGMASDCVGLEWDESDETLQIRHSCYGGKIDSLLHPRSAGPMVVAIRPGIEEADPIHFKEKQPEVLTIHAQPPEKAIQSEVIGFMKGDPQSIALDEAEVIVAGGGGIENSEDFKLIETLAELLGGTVGTSRVPVDRGWFPLKKQVGQTGSTVGPRLYLACGISGAIYHTMGMKDSKCIIGINKDRNAPIFDLADVGAVGDLYEIIPELIRELRAELETKEEA
ncbi:MAG: electron transfer flavoprotein subunit alpha/FixB family protein [Pseudomonadota bacterium]